MAEYISKEMAINFLCRLNEDIRFVNDMPTIDIVHCSECIHNKNNRCYTVDAMCDDDCCTTWVEVYDDYFCGNGERKE